MWLWWWASVVSSGCTGDDGDADADDEAGGEGVSIVSGRIELIEKLDFKGVRVPANTVCVCVFIITRG